MKKRGIGTVTLVILVILSGLIVTSATFLILNRDQLFSQQEDIQAEDTDITQAEEARECTDYISKEDCESDPYNAGNSEQLGWTELNCALAEINCGCKWNEEESKCKISMISLEEEEANETDETEQTNQTTLPDLIIQNLTVSIGNQSGVINETNETLYEIIITVTIQNIGNANAEASSTRLYNDGPPAPEAILLSTSSIGAGESIVLSYTFDLQKEIYAVRANADWSNFVQESNENNNAYTISYVV